MTSDVQAELDALNGHIGRLTQRIFALHAEWVATDTELRESIARRDALTATLNAATTAAPTAVRAPAASAPVDAPVNRGTAAIDAPAGPETSTRTVQNLLFILGGLLLGTAAIVFTAVAWANFGVNGRAVILAAVTVVALALPGVALWRQLRATAETIAGVGLLLVVLDGYAAWAVNLANVQSVPALRYAGVVCAVTAVIAAVYRRLTGLTGPALVAIVAAQPVAPLVIAPRSPGAATWALVFAAIAALDLLLVRRSPGATAGAAPAGADPDAVDWGSAARSVVAWCLHGVALAAATAAALQAFTATGLPGGDHPAGAVRAGLVLVVPPLVLVASGLVSGSGAIRRVAGGAVVVAAVAALARILAVGSHGHGLITTAAVIAAVAGATAALRRRLTTPETAGAVVGSAIATSVMGLLTGLYALFLAVSTLLPAKLEFGSAIANWQVPVAVVLVTAAVAILVPASARTATAVIGATVAVLTLPAALQLGAWTAPMLDVALVTVLLLGRRWLGPAAAIASAVLVGDAVGTSLHHAGVAAATLAALAVIGAVVALTGPTTQTSGWEAVTRGFGLVAALIAPVAALGAALVWRAAPTWWFDRATVTAAFVMVAVAGFVVRRSSSAKRSYPYAYAGALINAIVWPVVGALSAAEPAGIYGALGLVAVAVTAGALLTSDDEDRRTGATIASVCAAVPGGLIVAHAVARPVAAIAALPYTWLDAVWHGHPVGPGLGRSTVDYPAVPWSAVITMGLVALAAALWSFSTRRSGPGARTGSVRSALGAAALFAPITLLLALAAARAPWPTIPFATLLIGASLVVAGGSVRMSAIRTVTCTVQGTFYVGAGLAGVLPARWTTVAGFGLLVLAAAALTARGRTVGWRVLGAGAAGVAAGSTVVTASLAANRSLRDTAFALVAIGAVGLIAASVLRRSGRGPEGSTLDAVAQATGFVALAFTLPSIAHTSLASTLWGLAVGLCALWPGTSRSRRAVLTSVAGAYELLAWFLLLAAHHVALVEAYTIPLAAVALLAGLLARRASSGASSWAAYGPALAAGLLPSLATVLVGAGGPWRRLALGAVALVIVLLGARRRLRAPVLGGGTVLIVLALHEIVLWWDYLPRWLPLAVGGVVLVGVAITYERRRRDVAQVRAALRRMS